MPYNQDIFRIKNNNIAPEKGSILISEPFLTDKYFERSIVFLIEHQNEVGTMGFVLNKARTEKINTFFPELNHIKDITIYQGGPIATDRLFYLHTLGEFIPHAKEVIEGVYFGGDFDLIKSYISAGNPVKEKIKFFLGYSGWEQFQLQREIDHNSWLVSKLDQTRIMKADNESSWKKSLQELGDKYRSWANFPKRPFLN